MENRKFSCFDLFVTLISFLTLFVDIGTDVLVISQLYMRGSDTWGSVMLVFTVVPLLVMNVFSLKWHATDAPLTPSTILIHLFLLAPIHRYVTVLCVGYKSYMSGQRLATERALCELNDVSILRLLETFLEAAPQLVIQVYVMVMTPHTVGWVQGLSASCSLLSLAWALTAYSDTLRLTYQPAYHRRLLALALHCTWRLMVVSARVTALVLFASVLHAWLFVFAGMHWCMMTVWIWHQGADFGSSTAERVLFRVVSGFIYVFVFLNVHDGPSRQRMACYYCVVAVENAALFAVWCHFSQASSGVVAAAATVMVMGFVVGLLCLVVYYRWFHPSGPIDLFSVTPTVATHQQQTPQSAQEQTHQVWNSSVHTPSPGKSSTPDISSHAHHTPQKSSDKGGNLTLSFLLDSATKGELQWYSGMSSSEADSQCSSGMSEDDGLSFSLSDSVSVLTEAPPSHSLHTPSQSPPSATFTSHLSYSPHSPGEQGEKWSLSPHNHTSVWYTPSSSSSSTCSPHGQGHDPARQTARGRRDQGKEWCVCGPCKADSKHENPHTGRWRKNDLSVCSAVGGGDTGMEGGHSSHCSASTLSAQSLLSEAGDSTPPIHPETPSDDANSSSSVKMLSPLNARRLWRDSLRCVISATIRDIFPTHDTSACSVSIGQDNSLCSPLSGNLRHDTYGDLCSGDLSAGLWGRHQGEQSVCEREELSKSGVEKSWHRKTEQPVCGKELSPKSGMEKSWPQITAPLAEPESSDISSRSSPSVCVGERPPPSPPSPLSRSSHAAVSRSLPSDLTTSTPSPLSSSVDLPHNPCDLLHPSHSCCPPLQLRLDPAPPVGPEGGVVGPEGGVVGPEGGVAADKGMVCLLHQLPTASVDRSRRRSQGSPLGMSCLDHSPQRLGRSVDLFDPQAWRQWGGCSHPCRPRAGEEGGCGVSRGEVWFALSVNTSACGLDSHHRASTTAATETTTATATSSVTITAAAATTATTSAAVQGEGLYRYFLHPDSPVFSSGWTSPCVSYLDPNPGSPAVPCVWTTPPNSCGQVSTLSSAKIDRTHQPSTDPRRKRVAKGEKSSPRGVTWEDDWLGQEEDKAVRMTAYKTSHNLSRLCDKDSKRCRAEFQRTPLKSLQNSPHFTPLKSLQNSPHFKPRSPLQDITPRMMNKGCQRKQQHGNDRTAVNTSVDRRASSSEGRPPGSSVTRRPQQSRYRQAAGRKADRRSAARAFAGHPSVSATQSPPGLEMVI